jgi:hypothetical protein
LNFLLRLLGFEKKSNPRPSLGIPMERQRPEHFRQWAEQAIRGADQT